MIVVINAGSSSVKFAVFMAPGTPSRASLLSQGAFSGIGQTVRFRASDAAGATLVDQTMDATTTHEDTLDVLLGWLDKHYPDRPLLAAGHRVVHGGAHFYAPVMIDADMIDALRQGAPLSMGIDHPAYEVSPLVVTAAVRDSLLNDLTVS